MAEGFERFIADINEIDFDATYKPYPKQALFHESTKPFNFLGGAAGPGKTLCMIVEDMITCNEFGADDAKQVQTLMLRRTQPKLESTLVSRFREKIPQELYASWNEVKKIVTWKNGAITRFGSMQYDHNAWDWQGQWLRISYDELCEFTFNQWNATSAWNRCPVSPYASKNGAGNPIGIGAGWVKKLFVDGKPCDEMDEDQASFYNREDYAYFPCTYLDNPIYANDPTFLKNLNSYTKPVREALMHGTWGIVGGYFSGAWDAAYNVYRAQTVEIKPWFRRWISCDWGFEHWAAVYWHYMDEFGIVRTYREVLVKHQNPEVLAETIVKNSYDQDGSMPKFVGFALSHDAFASQATKTMGSNANPIDQRMSRIVREAGLPVPSNSGKDKLGRETLMYQQLEKRIQTGMTDNGQPIMQAAWQIEENCTKLIETIPIATRREKEPEKIEDFLGDDPLQGAGYGLYMIHGKPGKKPWEETLREAVAAAPNATVASMVHMKMLAERKKKTQRFGRQY